MRPARAAAQEVSPVQEHTTSGRLGTLSPAELDALRARCDAVDDRLAAVQAGPVAGERVRHELAAIQQEVHAIRAAVVVHA